MCGRTMKIKVYNPSNGNLIADGPSGISFGVVRAGYHGSLPVLIKPFKTTENNFTEMKLFLQNNGGLNSSKFGHFTSDGFIPGVDYTNYLSDHFSLATGVTGLGFSGVSGLDISIVNGEPTDYIWLDLEAGSFENGATSTINYRFVFDYN